MRISREQTLAPNACILPFITGDDAAAREFRALMRAAVAVYQKQREMLASLLASGDPDQQKVETYARILATLATRGGAPSRQDIEAAATALGVPAEQVDLVIRELAMRPGAAGPAGPLLYSMLMSHEREIRECYKDNFE